MTNLVIFGPPGTGKTHTLVSRSLQHPGPVTFCSHARSTARAAVLSVGDKIPANWTVSTIHSLCFRRLGLSRAQVVADENLQAFCKAGGFHLDSDDERPSELRFFMHAHSYARTTGVRFEEAFELCGALGSRTDFMVFCQSYDSWRNAYGFVDYTDMLMMCAERGFVAPVGMLVIDEAQDLTPLHWRVVDRLRQVSVGVRIAGDDDQAIYEWSGASPHGMVEFASRWGMDVEVLGDSRRVPRQVHELAMKIVGRISRRQPKEYGPRPAEGAVLRDYTLTKVRLRELYAAGSVMMLFRNKYTRAEYERLLIDARIPYVTERGTAPLQQKGGQAYRLLAQGKWHEPSEIRTIRAGLTPYAMEFADAGNGYHEIAWQVTEGPRPQDYIKCKIHVCGYLQQLKSLEARPVDLRTIHSAKGLEADSVIVVSSLTRQSLESLYKNPDAEHRVHYVAVTRAKERLVLMQESNAYDFPA